MNLANRLSFWKRATSLREPTVLMYHAIARVAEDRNRICVSPERFEEQMRYLKRRGLRGVSMRELLRTDSGQAGNLVGLTFDDGYENFLRDAMPVLEKFGFGATLFVLGGMLGAENVWDEKPRMSLLGAEEVREASRRGVEIGSHGMNHLRLAGLPTEELGKEIDDSRRVLEELLDEEVEGFCYPYGSVDEAAVRAARQAGYSYSCACWTRVENGVHDLPRMPVWEMDGPLLMSAKLEGFPLYSGGINSLSRWRNR